MLRLATADNNPTHKPISNGHSQRCTQGLGHEVLIPCSPDDGDQHADSDVANAPDPHERETELFSQRFSGDGKL